MSRQPQMSVTLVVITVLLGTGSSAQAADPTVLMAPPWQLRPLGPGSLARLDTVFALDGDTTLGSRGLTAVTLLGGAVPLTPELSVFGRLGLIRYLERFEPPQLPSDPNAPRGEPPPDPVMPTRANAVSNPVLGVRYAYPLGDVTLQLALEASAPLGSGGGDTPSEAHVEAMGAARLARASYDDALFTPNDLGLTPLVGALYRRGLFAVQLELGLTVLRRLKGEAVQPDAVRTFLTSGVFASFAVLPRLALCAELRNRLWLSSESSVALDASARHQTSVTIGPRGALSVADKVSVLPGLGVSFPLDAPMTRSHHFALQLDIPVRF
jgi:hypothetical protein